MEQESSKPEESSGVLQPDALSGDLQQSKALAQLNVTEEPSIYTSKYTEWSEKPREVSITSKK